MGLAYDSERHLMVTPLTPSRENDSRAIKYFEVFFM